MKIIADILEQITPADCEANDILSLLLESVLVHSAIYSKAAFLIATGREKATQAEAAAVAEKEMRLGKLSRALQYYQRTCLIGSNDDGDDC